MTETVALNDTRARVRAARPFPGPQRIMSDVRGETWLFRVFFALVLVAVVQSVVKANVSPCGETWTWFCDLELFDASAGLTLLVALGALFYTRRQVIEGFRPHVVYEGSAEARPGSVLAAQPRPNAFHITIRNIGSGTAIVQDTRYHLAFGGNAYFDLSYDEAVAMLKVAGLQPNEDFMLRSMSPGYGFAKGSELLTFEVLQSSWGRIDWLDCEIDFRGSAGPLYRKEVFYIPRDRDRRFGREQNARSEA